MKMSVASVGTSRGSATCSESAALGLALLALVLVLVLVLVLPKGSKAAQLAGWLAGSVK